jgi:hypothetical protein
MLPFDENDPLDMDGISLEAIKASLERRGLLFPKHEASLTLTHNDHKSVYETVAERVADDPYYSDAVHWVSEEQRQKAIASNEMWTLHWYPRTPVGFCVLHACDLDVLLKAANSPD